MKILKQFTLLVLVAISPFVHSATGVAFIHGTGHQTDALNDYWSSEFVDTVRQGITEPDNYVVINCDFDQYMWEQTAAGCLAQQLSSFISDKQIDSLTMITQTVAMSCAGFYLIQLGIAVIQTLLMSLIEWLP